MLAKWRRRLVYLSGFGRCEQFAASLRRVAIVLPGEIEKQNGAGAGEGGCGGGREGKRRRAAEHDRCEVQRHSSVVKKEGEPPRLYRRKNCIGDESAGGASV